MNDRPKLDPLARIYSAECCSVLGEKDKAFQFLEAAYEDRVSLLVYLDVRPTFNNIRSDPASLAAPYRTAWGVMNSPWRPALGLSGNLQSNQAELFQNGY